MDTIPSANRFPSTSDWRARESSRLAALRSTGLLDTPPEPSFDRLTRLATRLVGAPVSMISLVDEDRQFFKSISGGDESPENPRVAPRAHSFCRHVVERREPFVVEDARQSALMSESPFVEEIGIVAYLGIPIIVGGEHVIGSFCVNDHRPRHWTQEEIRALQDLAEVVTTEILLRIKIRELEKAAAALDEPDESEDSSDADSEPATVSGHGELILVADDVDAVRFATEMALQLNGYRTLAAADGTEALTLFAAHRHEIRAVLTDVCMPVMDGIMLLRSLQKMEATVPILAASGSGEKALAELPDLGFTRVLHKPFVPDVLIEALAAVLAAH